MEQKRERRRRDLARMKAKAATLGKRYGGNWGKLYNHLAFCSRPFCCGNPRHSFWYSNKERRTMQERRFYSEEVE